MSSAQQSGSLEEIVLTREQLEEMRKVQRNSVNTRGRKTDKGIGMLLDAYIRAKGYNRMDYLEEHSEYVRNGGINNNTANGTFSGTNPFRLKHLKAFVDELGVSEKYLRFVAERDPFTPTVDELEKWGREDGFFELIFHYVDLRFGIPVKNYVEESSQYCKDHEVSYTAFHKWVSCYSPPNLKHLKGVVDELEIPERELEKVCGRNLFKVTEDDLEKWNQADKGLLELFNFYINLNFGVGISAYFEDSAYVKSERLRDRTVWAWIDRKSCPRKHLYGLMKEVGIPEDELVKVYNMDPFRLTEEDLDRWSDEKGGIRRLFELYVDSRFGVSVTNYFRNHSPYASSNALGVATINPWFNGNNPFPPQHLKGFAEEIGVPLDYVKRVSGVDLEEVKTTAEELDTAMAGYLTDD